MKEYVYIIYADADLKIAEQLCEFIEKKGVECFFRNRDIPSNEQENSSFLKSAIEDSACIVAVVSNHPQHAKELEIVKESPDKCIAFVLNTLESKDTTWAKTKKVNATRHPTKMFGHLLQDVKKFVEPTKNNRKSIAIVTGVTCLLLLAFFALFLKNGQDNNNGEMVFPDYQDISQKEFLEKHALCRQSAVIHKNLPFGGVKYGINEQEWDQSMKKMIEKEGLTLNNKNQNGLEVPQNSYIISVNTEKNLILTLTPVFDDNKSLYVLKINVKRKSGIDHSLRPMLDEVLTEIMGVSDDYSDYEKWHVLKEGNLSPFYSLVKDNEVVNIRQEGPYELEITYINVPGIPQDIYDHENLTYEFNKRNIR